MHIKNFHLNQKGDTIVEVLIAMVILAFVLTGAYESAQYSINTIENAENRITAVDIATNQLELVKAWVDTASSIPNGNFYMNGSTPVLVPNGIDLPFTQNIFFYDISIKTPLLKTLNYTFIANVYWPDLNSNSVNNACKITNISACDTISIPYRSAINGGKT